MNSTEQDAVHGIPELDRAGLRHFGLSTGGIVIVLFGLLLPWLLGFAEWPRWPWLIGGGLAAWAMLAPASLGPVYRGWMRFGLLMGAIMNPLVLGLVFVLVLLPIGLIMRVVGKDPLLRRLSPDQESYRQPSRQREGKSMERPF